MGLMQCILVVCLVGLACANDLDLMQRLTRELKNEQNAHNHGKRQMTVATWKAQTKQVTLYLQKTMQCESANTCYYSIEFFDEKGKLLLDYTRGSYYKWEAGKEEQGVIQVAVSDIIGEESANALKLDGEIVAIVCRLAADYSWTCTKRTLDLSREEHTNLFGP